MNNSGITNFNVLNTNFLYIQGLPVDFQGSNAYLQAQIDAINQELVGIEAITDRIDFNTAPALIGDLVITEDNKNSVLLTAIQNINTQIAALDKLNLTALPASPPGACVITPTTTNQALNDLITTINGQITTINNKLAHFSTFSYGSDVMSGIADGTGFACAVSGGTQNGNGIFCYPNTSSYPSQINLSTAQDKQILIRGGTQVGIYAQNSSIGSRKLIDIGDKLDLISIGRNHNIGEYPQINLGVDAGAGGSASVTFVQGDIFFSSFAGGAYVAPYTPLLTGSTGAKIGNTNNYTITPTLEKLNVLYPGGIDLIPINLAAVSGLITITSLAGGVTMTTGAGAMTMSCGAGGCSISTGAGLLNLASGAGNIEASTISGNISLGAGKAFGGTSGDTILQAAGNVIIDPDTETDIYKTAFVEFNDNATAPATTANRLYQQNNQLYFDGNPIVDPTPPPAVNGITHYTFPATTPRPFPLPSAVATDSVVITSEISQNAGTGLIDLGCPVLGINNQPVFSFCPPITVSPTLVIFFDNLNGAANFFNPQTNVWTMGVISFQSTAGVNLQIFSACLAPAIGTAFPNQSLIVAGNFDAVYCLGNGALQNNLNSVVSIDLTTFAINPLYDQITSSNGRLSIIAVAAIPGGVNNYPTYATNGTQILFAYGGVCNNVSSIGGFGFYMVSSSYPQQTFIGGGPGGAQNNPPSNPNSSSAINTITYGPVLGLIFVGGSYANWNIGAGSGNITQYGSVVGYASTGTWNNSVSITQIGTPNNNWSGRLGIVQSNTDTLGDFFFSGDFKCPIGSLPVTIYSYPNANSYATNPYPTLDSPNTGAFSTATISFSVKTASTLSTITAQAAAGIGYVPILTNSAGQQQGINTPIAVWSYNATTTFIQSSNPVSGNFTISGSGFFARGINLYPYRVAAYTGIYVQVVNASIPGGQIIYQSVPINIPQASQSNVPYYLEFNNPASGYDAYPLLVNGSSYYFNVLPTSQTLGNGWWYDDNGTQSDNTFFVCSSNYFTAGNGSTQTITLNPAIPLEVGQFYTLSFVCIDADITGTQFMSLDTTTSPGGAFFTSTGSQQSGSGLINILDSAWVNYLNFSRPVQIPNMLGGIPSQPTISVCGTDLQHIYKCGWGSTPTPYTGAWVGENQYLFTNYVANTSQTTPPTSNGQIVWNSGTQTAATAIYVSTTDSSSVNNTTQLLKCNTGDILLLRDVDGNYQEFQLSSAPVNNTTYVTYSVFLSQSVGSAFTNGEAIKLTIYEFNAYQQTPIPIGVNGYYVLARDTTAQNGSIYLQSGTAQAVGAYRFIPPIINTSMQFANGVRFSLADSNITRTSNLVNFINEASSITMTKSISDPTLWILTAQSGNMGFASI